MDLGFSFSITERCLPELNIFYINDFTFTKPAS
jgi:hypothetical protein